MRYFLTLPLLFVSACAPPDNGVANNAVDINAAAAQAQNSVAAYAANSAADASTPSAEATQSPEASASVAPLSPPAPGTPGGLPDDRTPVSEAPFAPDSAQGAANVVQTYYALLAEKKYAQARALWEEGAGVSDAGAASLGRYAEYHADVGAPGEIDAGAGQRYVTVPVQIHARLKHGAAEYQIGNVTLHRTANIDGATAAQKSWHIRSIDLKPASVKQ